MLSGLFIRKHSTSIYHTRLSNWCHVGLPEPSGITTAFCKIHVSVDNKRRDYHVVNWLPWQMSCRVACWVWQSNWNKRRREWMSSARPFSCSLSLKRDHKSMGLKSWQRTPCICSTLPGLLWGKLSLLSAKTINHLFSEHTFIVGYFWIIAYAIACFAFCSFCFFSVTVGKWQAVLLAIKGWLSMLCSNILRKLLLDCDAANIKTALWVNVWLSTVFCCSAAAEFSNKTREAD